MSTHGLQWYNQCLNAGSLDALAQDWKADVLRISMYIQEGGYETNPRLFTDRVHNLIEQATARGMYAIVDWHMLDPGDPNYNLSRAKTFFTEIAQRHKDKKNGLSTPPRPTLRNLLNLASKPRRCWNMLGTRHRQFGNIVGHAKGVDNIGSLVEWTREQFDPRLSWQDIEWIKKRWGGKLIVKGIQDPEDARLAVDSGADAIVVSNHGGRQLDGASSSISTLPRIVEAVGHRVEVHMDGGIRSGQDVLKAIALGARGTYIGRAMMYGLGAMGEKGVSTALELIRNELDLSMAFCGKTDVRGVDRDILRMR